MLGLHAIRSNCRKETIRYFTRGSALYESKPSTTQNDTVQTSSSTSSSNSGNRKTLGPNMYAPTDFDKKILVWVKRYPSKDKIPDRITLEAMHAARSKARIKTCNWMILFAVIGFIGTAYSGKLAVSQGDSVLKRQLEYMEQFEKKK